MVQQQADLIAQAIGLRVELRSKELALAIMANLIATTPVLTGFARTNWVPTFDGPFVGLAGTKREARSGILDTGPQGSGLTAIVSQLPGGGRLKKKVGLGFRPGKSIFITNNVTYIQKLNAGSSTKAPAGFVQMAIADAQKRVGAG